MQTRLSAILVGVLLLSSAAAAQAPRAIFDGASLKGFEGDLSRWCVENGELVGRSTAARPLERSTWLLWRGGTPADFKLEFDYRLTGGNSGVQFRSRDEGDFQVAGYQADLEDGPDWTGCLYEQGGRGVCARRGQTVRFDADGSKTVLDLADGARLLDHVHGREWNHGTIVARGSSIAIAINGVPMTSVTDLDPAHFSARGLLAFQLHQGPPMEVRFKNLLLTEYDRPAQPDGRQRPQWIWTSKDAGQNEVAVFEKRFRLERLPATARLAGSADNFFEVHVNGARVLEHDDWEAPVYADVAKHLQAGDNTISIRAENEGGPAGMHCALDLEFADGSSRRIASDTTWLATPRDLPPSEEVELVPWQPAVSLGDLGTGVWGERPAPVLFTAVGALSAEELKLPEGFRAELLYSVPKRTQGSWVAMCFDDRGRILASDQYGPLYRVTLANGAVSGVEELAGLPGRAHGLLYAFDALYVVVADGGGEFQSGLWRAKRRGDDGFGEPELLKAFEGDGEHGPHAVVLSPDKRSLYVVGGNHTQVPSPLARSLVPQCWGEDQLLPQHADPNGHAVGIVAPGGWICRTDPDGRQWELFAAGFRNAYDMAFDQDGEAFTFDSDMEWDMGLPWYRPTMIEHVVAGGDYGWRTGSWRWPAYYPDSLPGVVDIGASSPTGVCFVPEGSDFHTPNGGRLLVGDWAYGKIYSVALHKDGASYGGSFESLIEGKPLPVTDMEFGPDGALYFLVGGRRTQSALYRINGKATRDSKNPPGSGGQDEQRADTRRRMARLVVEREPGDPAMSVDLLDSNDRFLRYAGRVGLELGDPLAWTSRALTLTGTWAPIEGLIAVARRAPPSMRDRALDAFEKLPLEKLREDELLGALRALQLVCIRLGDPQGSQAARIEKRLDALFPHPSDFANRELCQLLVRLKSPAVAGQALELLERATSKEQQIALAWALRSKSGGWTVDERLRYFRWMNQNAAAWSGGHSFAKYLDNLRDDAIASLDPEETRLLAALLDKPRPVEASSSAPPRPLVRRWTLDELLPVAASARRSRDFSRGAQLFREARCLECHRIAGTGGGSGPDLTGAGSRFGDLDLLEAVLEPSKVISDQYQDTEVLTRDDRQYVGRLERLPQGGVRLWPADAPEPIAVDAEEIELLRPYATSRMPTGLLDTFTGDELADLIAYLRSGANRDDPSFERKK